MNIIKRVKQYFDTKYFAIIKKLDSIENRIKYLDQKNDYLFFTTQYINGLDKPTTLLKFPKATGELRRIQLAENQILMRLKKICEQLNINFFLVYGTALGAVRHKGFIPWDDDLDIGMMLSDFMKLEKRLNDDEFLEAHYYYQMYGYSFVKVKFKGLSNIFVDIFLFETIDATKDDVCDKMKLLCEKYQQYGKVIINYFSQNGLDLNYKKPLYIAELDELAQAELQRILEELPFYGRQEGQYIVRAISNCYKYNCWEKDLFLPIKRDKFEFEGHLYDAVNFAEELLRQDYGDYMALPAVVSGEHHEEFDSNLETELNIIEQMGINN